LSDDPDTATQQTVQEMCRQIHQAAGDPMVQRAARLAMAFAGGPANVSAIDACWWWVKHALRFKHHGGMFEAWSSDLGDPSNKLQLLIAPDVLVRMSRMEGDCAIYTMMLCAMLESLGIQWEIVTAAVDARQPEIFGHVWPRAVLPGGNRESLDASHGRYPGWQVPSYDLHRVWIFNDSGVRVAEQGPGFSGLHAYRARRGFGRLGLGATCVDDGEGGEICTNDGTDSTGDGTVSGGTCPGSVGCPGYIDPNASVGTLAPSTFSNVCADGSAPIATGGCSSSGGYATGYTAPSPSSSAAWAAFATAMGKAGMTLAQINAIQPGTVVSANGTILRQSTGYAVPGSTLSTSLGSMSSTSMLMLAGVAVVALMFMGGRK